MSQILALARGGLSAFFAWWWNELAGLLPRGWSPDRRRRRRLLVLTLGGGSATLAQGSGAGGRLISQDELDDPGPVKAQIAKEYGRRRQAIVRLAPHRGLRKSLELPAAAKDDLEHLLRFEMDRLTPFRADEVLFAYRPEVADPQGRRLRVELQLAPKTVVQSAVDDAQRLGLVPVRVELGDLDDAEAALDLLPDERAGGPGMSRLNRALALLALLLAAAAVGIPLNERRSTAADLEARVAAARAEAEASLQLRERLERLRAEIDFLAAEKTRIPMTSMILAEVTRVVPDQAYLSQLDWRNGTLQLEGLAVAATSLVGLLDSSPMFGAPQFRSPVTPDRRTELERFHVAVELTREEG